VRIGVLSLATMPTNLLQDILKVAITVYQSREFEPFIPFLAAKKHEMRLTSKLGNIHRYGIN
jgi:hypothetical protein